MRRLFGRGSAGDSPQQPSPSPSPPLSSLHSSVNIAAGPARPIRFVYCDEKGKFQLDPEALSILQLVKEPVGIVSVCGRARQGKSFILNQVNFSKVRDKGKAFLYVFLLIMLIKVCNLVLFSDSI